jgi:leukotriene-A4 hydrolase
LAFSLDETQKLESLGTPLIITFPNQLNLTDKINITIHYETTENSAAVQWLTPEMTLGKKYPFMFTQCEAILCRTLLPCQDSPAVKVLVSSALTVKKPLTALYAGIKTKQPVINGEFITFYYEIKTRIPTYLIAIAAGALESRNIGPRTNVWAEKELVDASAWEFKETESFIQTVNFLIYIHLFFLLRIVNFYILFSIKF